MKNAKVWIENNPQTGSAKPFEVWWQTEGLPAEHAASCASEEGAQKSLARTVKRNKDFFNIEAGA